MNHTTDTTTRNDAHLAATNKAAFDYLDDLPPDMDDRQCINLLIAQFGYTKDEALNVYLAWSER